MVCRPNLPKLAILFICTLAMGSMLPDCSDPTEVCEAAAEAAAKALVRCDNTLDLAEQKQGFINQAALGSCQTIKKIRDLDALHQDCLPWLERAPCEVFESIALGQSSELPACKGQFLLE